MKITDITKQKSKSRLNIYVDGDFYGGIGEAAAADLNLYVGKEVFSDELSSVETTDEYYKALERSLGYLSIRKHSVFELNNKLGKYYPLDVVKRVTNRLLELNYLNDREFAESYITYRQFNYGRKKIESELILRGVSREIVKESTSACFDTTYAKEVILKLIEKKDNPELDLQKRREKVLRFLISKGFDYSEVKELVANYYNQ